MAEAASTMKENFNNLDDIPPIPPENILEDPDYVPQDDTDSEHSFGAHTAVDINNNVQDKSTQTPEKSNKRRKAQPDTWKKSQRKIKRNRGESYEASTGKIMPEKSFKDYNCYCPLKCSEVVSSEQRKKSFDSFYQSGSWDLQTSYIIGHVKTINVNRRYGEGDPQHSRRQHTRYYYFDNSDGHKRRVCKSMFMQTLALNSSRIHRALLKGISGTVTDLRGKHEPGNKVSEERLNEVREHILSFPRYTSHYCRKDSTREYLSSDLNVNQMYKLYLEKYDTEEFEKVSQSTYERVFYEEFNLFFKTPEKDTCKFCDEVRMQFKDTNEEKRNQAHAKHDIHLTAAADARNALNTDKKCPETDARCETITFDLQKTLPTPKIPTGIAYYKRQLWVFNLGIHAYKSEDESVYMFMWHEGTASRGSQEVSSCLKYFVKNGMSGGVEHLTAWSDSCGGQNRNIKVCCMWMHLLATTNLQIIDHKFLESGHSYLPCDSDFGDIERSARRNPVIYSPDEWYQLVRKARSKHPFKVIEMSKDDFYSSETLERAIVNRKITESGQKVQWLKMKHIRFTKAKPLVMQFKYSHREEEFMEVSLKSKRKSQNNPDISCDQVQLRPKGIKREKIQDLKSLLAYIPPVHHSFYRSLKSDSNASSDDICGNNIDYELED